MKEGVVVDQKREHSTVKAQRKKGERRELQRRSLGRDGTGRRLVFGLFGIAQRGVERGCTQEDERVPGHTARYQGIGGGWSGGVEELGGRVVQVLGLVLGVL